MKNKLRKVLVLSAALALLVCSTLGVSAAELKDLFDAEYYAEKYADVAAAFGEDEAALYQHYVTYGVKEGRKASEVFDVANYREQYADLEKAFGDDWAAYVNHYLTFGLKEERDGGGEFDAVSYAKRYADVYEAYGYDLKELYQHYQAFGEKEGRNAESAKAEEKKAAATAGSSADSNCAADNGADSNVTPVDPKAAKAIELIQVMETEYCAFMNIANKWNENLTEEEVTALLVEMGKHVEPYNAALEGFWEVTDAIMNENAGGGSGWPKELQDVYAKSMAKVVGMFGEEAEYVYMSQLLGLG